MPALLDFDLWGRGRREQVVGEKFHADQIRPLFPRRITEGSSTWEGMATLAPEPDNPHDRNAVAVVVDGRRIGHLAKEIAAPYSQLLQALGRRGLRGVTRCYINASEYPGVEYDARGREKVVPVFHAGATIMLEEAHLCFPVNEPPPMRHRLIPYGPAVQLTGEENHLATLAPWVRSQAEVWVWGTLTIVMGGTAKTPKEIVEVLVDGRPVGRLSPAASAHYLATMKHLESAGLTASARLLLKGNALKVEAVLHAAKAHEIDSAWVAELTPAQGIRQPQGPVPDTAPAPRRKEFNPPPGWPRPPQGWEPPPGWEPSPTWPPAPAGWQFWV